MLNLSDKELDRLSKEAAQEYEPGDVLGPNSWEKLQSRLDGDLGHFNPNPLRHIRRFPFYYAPALLVLLGISYYYLTKSPPASRNITKNTFTNQIPTNSVNSTPAAQSSANPARSAAKTGVSGTASNASSVAAAGNASDASSLAAAGNASNASSLAAAGNASKPSANATVKTPSDNTAGNARTSLSRVRSSDKAASPYDLRTSGNNASPNEVRSHDRRSNGHNASSNLDGERANAQTVQSSQYPQPGHAAQSTPQPREPERSTIGGLSATKTPADISDSALKAFTLKSMPPAPIKRALYIRRDWQFGLMAAPDFASVNALAGDKPGSSVGITVDYQFAPRWYISSGLLLDRRNYAARAQDFHAPLSYYSGNGIDPKHVDFVKGSLRMLEIPLNLRYDFSVTGSTLFFASAGVSTFLLTAENGNCYVSTLSGREMAWGYKQPGNGNYLFSTMNLSLGVETGLSNSMSLLIAPYIKMPIGGIGFGQVQMNSVGITFGVKWAPVTSMRRR